MSFQRSDKFSSRILQTLDSVFLAFFGRRRRRLGDSNIEAAWRSATFSVTAYLVLPIVVVLFMLIYVLNAFSEIELTSQQRQSWQIIAGLAVVVVGVLLDRRFKKYLTEPPILASEESQDERSLVRRYRFATILIFIAACVVAYAMYSAGLGLKK